MELRVAKKYRVGRRVGHGSFSDVYGGVNVETGEDVAIKLEAKRSRHQLLHNEAQIYQMLQGGKGIPSLMWSGSEGDYNILVTNLLGPSLDELFDFKHRKLTLKTTLMLADQMISVVEFVHSRHYVHCDIKPENFLIGTGHHKNTVYLIDFGLAKMFEDNRSGSHIPYSEGNGFIGTYHFASINAHLEIELSRRDDMISLGYNFMYFLRGSLPWQRVPAKTKPQKHQKVLEIKQDTSAELLCQDYPAEFREYFAHCSTLGFDDCPDYSYLKELFHKLFENSGFQDDELFDWDTAPEKRVCEDDLAETSKEILENVEASDPQSKVVG